MHESEAQQVIEQAYEARGAEDWPTAADRFERVARPLPGRRAQRRVVVRRGGWIVARLGLACVRLDTGGEREVVWIRPAVPDARAGAERAHDRRTAVRRDRRARRGTPGRAHRRRTAHPVFDELLLFEASELPTLEVTVDAGTPADVAALLDLFTGHDCGAEPASGLEPLCTCCSEGTLEQERSVHAGTRRISLAAPEDEAGRLLERWAGETSTGRSRSGLVTVG
ncbi:hypothetical protein ACIBBD_01645 [Streptomyces sp. NPDC051315]|uniref:hypothetical protein n=1 Tax=Streptomyces sp. NPDC051315 TaxID=3365650 RepID=UPI00378C08E6